MTSMRTLAAQPPMKEASTRAFIGFVACCTEGSLLKKNGRSLESKKMRRFLKEKRRRPASVSLTLIQSFIQHLVANESVAFHTMEPLSFNEILIFRGRGIQKLTI